LISPLTRSVARKTASNSDFLVTMDDNAAETLGTRVPTTARTASASSDVTVPEMAQQSVPAFLRRVSSSCSFVWIAEAAA
jgi:hypothetical protein